MLAPSVLPKASCNFPEAFLHKVLIRGSNHSERYGTREKEPILYGPLDQL